MSKYKSIEIWKNLYKYIKNSTSVKDFDIPDDIKNIIEELDSLFNDTIFDLFKQNKDKKICDLFLQLENIIKTSSKSISYYGERIAIDDIDKYRKTLQEIKKQFDDIPNINAYIEAYKKNYKMGEIAIEEAQKAYNKRVAELLGKTTETYLFSEYQKQADEINNRIGDNSFFLFLTIIFIFLTGILCLKNTLNNLNNTIDITYYLFSKITMFIPLIFALLFLNRNIRDDRKLEQTYRHKEVVSKSYLNYLDFLDANPMIITNDKGEHIDNSQLIKEKVSQIAVESLGLNPALLLDKSTSEKIPMEELLSKILDKTIADKKG
ncbi:hypothetical protein P9074_11185 [Gallibacterium anatis]|uniref:hypothetical protein n=1 Tax=Gallibacterium anatis TaxID=750 RepID=UPI003007102A